MSACTECGGPTADGRWKRCRSCHNVVVEAGNAATFWDRLDRSGPCWVWTGRLMINGYGRLYVRGRVDGAHRRAWELANGRRIPPGMLVRHSCDNPPCCNPAHLSIGTVADNSADMVARGRTGITRGEANPRTRLTAADVREMRALHAGGGWTLRALGEQYGVANQHVDRIVKRRVWTHL